MTHTYAILSSLDPELLRLVEERRVADPEQLGRLGPAPPGPLQSNPDQLALELPDRRLEIRPLRGDGDPEFEHRSGLPPFGGPASLPHREQPGAGNLGARRQEGASLHQVAKLADVPPPLVGGHRRESVRRQKHLTLPVLPAIVGQEVLCQERNIVAALPQGGHMDPDHVEAIEEVLAKTSPRHLALEIPRRGG